MVSPMEQALVKKRHGANSQKIALVAKDRIESKKKFLLTLVFRRGFLKILSFFLSRKKVGNSNWIFD